MYTYLLSVSSMKTYITNITGSYIGFYHSPCVVISNLKTDKQDPRRAVRHLVDNDMKMFGIEVKFLSQKRLLVLVELHSPDQCSSVITHYLSEG